jgi:transposase-like protein
MRKSKLDSPHTKVRVVKQLAPGQSQSSIAKEVGLNQSQVCRFANREDIRTLIEQEQARLLEVVPDAVENVKDLVKEIKGSSIVQQLFSFPKGVFKNLIINAMTRLKLMAKL